MARRDITQYFDDLDNTLVSEEDLHVVRLSMAGTEYLLDLSEDNAAQLRRVLEPYLHAARKVPSATTTTRKRTGEESTSRQIRQWAQDQGTDVSPRGKIPQKIVDAYTTVHPGSRKK